MAKPCGFRCSGFVNFGSGTQPARYRGNNPTRCAGVGEVKEDEMFWLLVWFIAVRDRGSPVATGSSFFSSGGSWIGIGHGDAKLEIQDAKIRTRNIEMARWIIVDFYVEGVG